MVRSKKLRKLFHGIALASISLNLFLLPSYCEPIVLQGNLTHAEKLVDSGQQIGKPLARTDNCGGDKDWFQVPSWLAGEWLAISTVMTEHENVLTGESQNTSSIQESRFTDTFGYQRDKYGNVWSIKFIPDVITVHEKEHESTEPQKAKMWVVRRTLEPVSENTDRALYKITEFMSKLDSAKMVIEQESRESFAWYVNLKSGQIARLVDTMSYDKDGHAVERYQKTSILRRSKVFTPRDEAGNRNLRTSFCKYLELSGQGNLIPQKTGAQESTHK
ncbi:MAG: hypothetical protein K2Y32_15835 [Candidatus Obscuribacterales bacterium]|nr:hypothetical protein [Candidatus Obscuribacterales bacterium]